MSNIAQASAACDHSMLADGKFPIPIPGPRTSTYALKRGHQIQNIYLLIALQGGNGASEASSRSAIQATCWKRMANAAIDELLT